MELPIAMAVFWGLAHGMIAYCYVRQDWHYIYGYCTGLTALFISLIL